MGIRINWSFPNEKFIFNLHYWGLNEEFIAFGLIIEFYGCNNQISGTLELFEDVKLKEAVAQKTIPAGVHLASIEIKSNKKFCEYYGQTLTLRTQKLSIFDASLGSKAVSQLT